MHYLHIELNCMCLFAPDPLQPGGDTGTMHVLMPQTGHCDPKPQERQEQQELNAELDGAEHEGESKAAHEHGRGSSEGTDDDQPRDDAPGHRREHMDEHVVRLYYVDRVRGRSCVPLEGWSLVVGNRNTPAASLRLPNESGRARVVDLTELTAKGDHPKGRRVPRHVLDQPHNGIVTCISLREGESWDLESQAPRWKLNREHVAMAHRVIWRVRMDDAALTWAPLNDTRPECQPPSLADIEGEDERGDKIYRLDIHHVAKNALPDGHGFPTDRALSLEQIQNHFGMFYKLLGVEPDADQLPQCPDYLPTLCTSKDRDERAEGWACKVAKAQVEPAAPA